MSEIKDPAIKLFGKLLHLQQQKCCSGDIKKTLEKQYTTTQTDYTCSNNSTSSGTNIDDPKTPTTEKETSSKNTAKRDAPIANPNSEEKLQKPDKILPCPRCNSMDTKFCYYNNYNVKQPRHFCKMCQRYWTAGGTMRNTPVGSGRRKNKCSSSASYFRHLVISDTSLKRNGSFLNFGSDVPLCESMNLALNFCDKSQKCEDNQSGGVASNLVEEAGNNGLENLPKYPLQLPCFPTPPWNSTQYRPVSFYPTPPYWGCTLQVQPTPWSMPCVTPPNQITPSSSLGKHSRDKDLESGVLIPKTLRINDAKEAAKSSLWSTLGISKEESCNNSNDGGNLYKAFQLKSDEKNEVVVASSLFNLQANPAALSRSLNFHETS